MREGVTRRSFENIPAERAVLGSILNEPQLFWQMNGSFRPDIFTTETHRNIAAAIKFLGDSGREISPHSVLTQLPPIQEGESEQTPEGYVAMMAAEASRRNLEARQEGHSGLAEELLSDLVAMHGRRRMREGGSLLIQRSGEDDGRDPSEVVDEIFDTIRRDVSSASLMSYSAGQALDEALALAASQKVIGLPWFIPQLDDLAGLMDPGFLIGLQADAKAGKTSFTLCLARHAAQYGKVLIFSMEMKRRQLAIRLASQISMVPELVIARGLYTEEQYKAVLAAKAILSGMRIEIVDKGRLTVRQMRAKAMEEKRRGDGEGNPLRLMIFDHLKIIQSERRGTEIEQIGDNMVCLKALTNDVEVPGVITMQRKRINPLAPRPSSEDAFGGGATLENVDIMVAVWREWKYLMDHPPAEDASEAKKKWYKDRLFQTDGKAEIINNASRYGKPGSVFCEFIGNCGLYRPFGSERPALIETSVF